MQVAESFFSLIRSETGLRRIEGFDRAQCAVIGGVAVNMHTRHRRTEV